MRRHTGDNSATASVDRRDNALGYTPANIQFVHKDINRMKWAWSKAHFINLCHQVSQHQSKGK